MQSLARGLAVLRSVGANGASATLAEIAARSGLSRAAARRLVLTLEHLGYVQATGREYASDAARARARLRLSRRRNLTDLAQPWMEQLAHQVNESCSMAVLDGQDIVYVARVLGAQGHDRVARGRRAPAGLLHVDGTRAARRAPARASRRAGSRDCEPVAYTNRTVTDPTRLRRIIDNVRRDGYVWVEQELETGLCSIAVPVRDRAGRVVAALNLGMPFHADAKRRATNELLPALRQTAHAIERCMPANWLAPVG